MIPHSAMITIGEPPSTIRNIEQGLSPRGEYAVLSQNHFDQVITMYERGMNPGSAAARGRFALVAHRDSWGAKNIFLGEEFPGIQYLALQALFRRPKSIAMIIHNVTSKKRRLLLANLGLVRLVDRMLCLSTQSKRDLVEMYGVSASRVIVIGSRVDTDFFRPEQGTTTQLVCSAGAVNRDYGTLVEAVRPLGITTKIAADTAWRYSATPILPANIPAFVEMRSWGNYRNLRALYAAAAVVVVPLLKPHVLSGVTVALEAMAMGKPVILTHSPYVADFLTDGETGFFVPAGDSAALRERIRYVLDHADEAERIGARAREWVCERFTVDHYVKRILSAWED